jgi:phospholipid N-methyltransferase
MNEIRERALFIKNAFFDREIGAMTMSSQYVVKRVITRLPKPLLRVVEYGSGNGVMTRALLEHLSPDGTLVAIESNPLFVDELRRINDKRLEVISGKVQDVLRVESARLLGVDAVVSSIPFSFLTADERRVVVSDTHALLASGGSFIIFHQYSWLMAEVLAEKFADTFTIFEPRNVLPCFIIDARKEGSE